MKKANSLMEIKQQLPSKPCFPRPLAWVLALMLIGGRLQGQVVIQQGRDLPATSSPNVWFLDTVRHCLSMHFQTGWRPVTTHTIRSVESCRQFVFATRLNGYIDIFNYKGAFIEYCTDYYCGSDIIIYWSWDLSWSKYSVIDRAGNLIYAQIPAGCYTTNHPLDTLQGIIGHCLPLVPRINSIDTRSSMNCTEVHNWGFLGSNGKWLIKPIYDAPFSFQDGIAEVLYYGQKRQINEKGEQLEPLGQ